MPRDMASVAIEGNTVENSPYTNIISTESINFYVFCNVPHDEDTDTKDSLYWTSLQAWFAAEDRTAQSRDSSLPDLFASSLTNWVLRDAAFHACSLQKGQTVLLRGGMGVGKTTTMCGLIKHLHDCGTVAVAFMLADSDRKSEHSPRKILMLFVQQLSNDNRKQRKHAWKLVNKNLTGRPSAHEARGTLVSIIKSHYDMKKRRTTCLLLDGLDEFEDDDLQELLCHLAEVQQLTSCGIILASRVDNLNTKKWFKKLEPLEIMAHSADIKYYVDKAYRGSAVDGLDRQHRGKIASISEAVAAGSCGSFLLAMLNTSHLIKMPPAGFKKALNEVRNIASQPATREESTLEGKVYPCAFDRNIRRLSRRQGAGDILTFVRDGGRPFSTIELQYVLALHNKPETFDEATLCHGSGFSDITQGIVTVGNGGLVGFVHPGLKTYLQHDRKIDGCILDLSDKNSVLAQICVSYLSSPRFTGGPCTSREELENRISESPFLDYAVKYWHMHYTEASKNEADVALRKSVVRFLSQEGSVSSARQCMAHSQSLSKLHELNSPQDLSRNGSPESLQWTYPDQTRLQTTGLHLAIHLRLDELAIILTTDLKPSVVNRADGNGATPLHLAVAFGANDVVRMIVLHGGNLNMRNTKGFSPWHIAAAKGDLPAVTTFLDQATERLDVNLTVLPKGFQQQTQPVIAPNNASTRSWMYNGRDIRTATALHLAARNGHVEVVQQIISDKRCNKLAEDCFGMSEFHKACKYGRLEVVKLLINIHQKYIHHSSCKDGRTGFHVACKYDAGYEVAKYLLEAYPDLCRMKDKSGNVALHHAAVGGNVKTVQMLLQQSDINVNESNHAGQTPLELAARHPSPAICTLYDHEGVRRWVEIEGTPIEDIVQRYRHKPTEV